MAHHGASYDDLALPTFEESQTGNVWWMILPFLDTGSLLTLSRSCWKIRYTVQSYLWISPRTFFPADRSDACAALEIFFDGLTRSWLSGAPLRSSAFTVRLDLSGLRPPDGVGLDLRNDWLWIVGSRFPSLHLLFLDGVDILDTQVLATTARLLKQTDADQGRSEFFKALRFLSVAYCHNTSSQGLSAVFGHLPRLLYIDISGVDQFQLAAQAGVQVVKARNSRALLLDREDVSPLSSLSKASHSIRSLDLRNSQAVNDGVANVIAGRFGQGHLFADQDAAPPVYEAAAGSDDDRPSWANDKEIWVHFDGLLRRRTDHDDAQTTALTLAERQSDFDAFVLQPRERLPRPPLDLKLLPGMLTHLRISNTQISARGTSVLLLNLPLRLLDIGSIDIRPRVSDLDDISINSNAKQTFASDSYALGAAIFLRALRQTRARLRWLRIGFHAIAGYMLARDELQIEPLTLRSRHAAVQSDDGANAALLAFFARGGAAVRGTQWDPSITPADCLEAGNKIVFEPALFAIDHLQVTDIPSHSPHGHTVSTLLAMLRACADVERHAEKISAPRRGTRNLVLEFVKQSTKPQSRDYFDNESDYNFDNEDDTDLQALKDSAGQDFSFFPGEGGQGDGFYAENAPYDPRASSSGRRDSKAAGVQDRRAALLARAENVVDSLRAFRATERERGGSGWTGELTAMTTNAGSWKLKPWPDRHG